MSYNAAEIGHDIGCAVAVLAKSINVDTIEKDLMSEVPQ